MTIITPNSSPIQPATGAMFPAVAASQTTCQRVIQVVKNALTSFVAFFLRCFSDSSVDILPAEKPKAASNVTKIDEVENRAIDEVKNRALGEIQGLLTEIRLASGDLEWDADQIDVRYENLRGKIGVLSNYKECASIANRLNSFLEMDKQEDLVELKRRVEVLIDQSKKRGLIPLKRKQPSNSAKDSVLQILDQRVQNKSYGILVRSDLTNLGLNIYNDLNGIMQENETLQAEIKEQLTKLV